MNKTLHYQNSICRLFQNVCSDGICSINQKIAKILCAVVLLVITTLPFQLNAQQFIFTQYERTFTNGVSSTTADCDAFNTWRATLTRTDYQIVRMRSTIASIVIEMTNPTDVMLFANNLRNGVATTLTSGPNAWNIGTCGGGLEVSVNNGGNCLCGTGTNNSCVRPCINNLNWGGHAGATCSAPTQTITLEFGWPAPPSGPQLPPIANFFPSMANVNAPIVDTVWLNSPYTLVSTSQSSSRTYWDLPNVTNLPFPYFRQSLPFTTQQYIDTLKYNRTFTYTFNQRGFHPVRLLAVNYLKIDSLRDSVVRFVYVDTPSRVPKTDFISFKRKVGFGDYANMLDLSSY
ncbi:MAG: hypothetical protein ACK4K9_01865, partial [Bacteroidia bacterium]